jgi:hypothetical protein
MPAKLLLKQQEWGYQTNQGRGCRHIMGSRTNNIMVYGM